MGPIDILFVNPPSPDQFIYIRDINRHGRSSWERMIWPQTGLAYLASVAEAHGFTISILDCIAERIGWPEYENRLKELRPKFIFSNIISVTYSNDLRALRLAKDISNAVTIGMGPHLTNSPGESLVEATPLDFVFTHEAERTLGEFLDLARDGLPSVEILGKIEGIAFIPSRLEEGASSEPVVTNKRAFIADLDELPWPKHELLPLNKYWAPFLGKYTFVESSRGCAYRCTFCRQAVMWEWKFRSRSGKELAKEALYVHSLGVDNILFHADTFTLNRAVVEELCDILIEAGTPFKWACNAHVRTLYEQDQLVEKMKKAGCWMIAIGIESGDDQVLENMKKQVKVAEAEAVVRMVDKAKIEAWGYFIIGLPGETKETIEKTIRLSLDLPLQIAKFDIAAPYPGTEFDRYVKENNLLSISSYEDYDQNASCVVEYPDLSKSYIKKSVKRATRKFYLRPRILLRLMKEVTDFTALKTIFLIARDQILLLKGKRRSREDSTIQLTPAKAEKMAPANTDPSS